MRGNPTLNCNRAYMMSIVIQNNDSNYYSYRKSCFEYAGVIHNYLAALQFRLHPTFFLLASTPPHHLQFAILMHFHDPIRSPLQSGLSIFKDLLISL
jgi:hypothetical protein